MTLKLVIFDVDGTLVDSLDDIVEVMARAFADHGLEPPESGAVRAIVGRSLDLAVAELIGPEREAIAARVANSYRAHFGAADAAIPPKLFPGAIGALQELAAQADTLLGVATGKSRRGLSRLFHGAGLDGLFQTVQTADDARSKPHPEMILNALRETGVDRAAAVMVGDSTLDMAMARAAGIAAIGVTWGSHGPDALAEAGAGQIVDGFGALAEAIEATLAGRGLALDA